MLLLYIFIVWIIPFLAIGSSTLAPVSLWHTVILFLNTSFFWHHKMFQSHLLFFSSPAFPKSFGFFHRTSEFINRDFATRSTLMATRVSLLLGSLSGQRWEIYIWILTHTYTHLHLFLHISICVYTYIKSVNSYSWIIPMIPIQHHEAHFTFFPWFISNFFPQQWQIQLSFSTIYSFVCSILVST